MPILIENFLSPEVADQLLARLEQVLKHRFADRSTALRSLAHRSLFEAGSGEPVTHNERLEFLGDAVVNWLVVDELYRRYPAEAEGRLSALKSKFVSTAPFSRCADELGLPELLQMSSSAERSGTRDRPNIREDLFEAVMGALYLDAGPHAVKRVLEQVLFPKFEDLDRTFLLRNWKGEINERLQGEGKEVAVYRVAEVTGPDHAQQFVVEVLIDGEVAGRGEGSTKLAAEQLAAQSAQEAFFQTPTQREEER